MWTEQLSPRRLDLYQYSSHESRVLRIISISSCSASLVACLVMYYTFLAIHPSRRKFRHQLIFFLVTFDFLKSIAMIVFPILTYLDPEEVGQKTINFLGFFTAFSIEGSDLAILSFAIHTFLTIFYPRRTGGLYFIRNHVYVGSVVIPMLLAGLAFINKGNAYTPLTVFCYLPLSPVAYRMALSWGPRYFIMLAILIIYCTIYFYVINQLKKMEHSHGLQAAQSNEQSIGWICKLFMGSQAAQSNEQPTGWICKLFMGSKKPANDSDDTTTTTTSSTQRQAQGAKRTDTTINVELQLENSQRLRTRYKIIARQMKIVFLYPIAYFILWIFPLIQSCLQLRNQSSYPISVLVVFMTPLNGIIDTLVFLYREKPWLLTYMNTPRSPFLQEEIPKWRKKLSFLPLYSLPDEDTLNDPTMLGAMEAKMLKQDTNALMASVNPEEFLHTPTQSSFEEVAESSGTTSYKRKGSAVSTTDEGDEDDGMDFLDFLNNGPPV